MSSLDDDSVRTPEITMICACSAIMFFVLAFVLSAIDPNQVDGMSKDFPIEYRLFVPVLVGVILLAAGGLISLSEVASAIAKTVYDAITNPGMP